MTELQAAVALAQLGRVEQVAAARTRNGELLTSLLAGQPGLYPQRVSGAATAPTGSSPCAWWSRNGSSRRGGSRRPSGRGYPVRRALHRQAHLPLRGPPPERIFGTSNYPWSLQDPAHAVRYEEGECPNAERALSQMLTLPMHEASLGEAELRDVAVRLRKSVRTPARPAHV